MPEIALVLANGVDAEMERIGTLQSLVDFKSSHKLEVILP